MAAVAASPVLGVPVGSMSSTCASARAVLDEVEGADVDYVEVLDPQTLERVDRLDVEARLVMAVKLGGVRLLDNGPLFAGLRAAGVHYP